jgi:hypothetical protein
VAVSVKGETRRFVIFESTANFKSSTIWANSLDVGTKLFSVFALVNTVFNAMASCGGKVLQVLRKDELPAPTADVAAVMTV